MDGREAEIAAVTDEVNGLLDDLAATVAALNALLGNDSNGAVAAGEEPK